MTKKHDSIQCISETHHLSPCTMLYKGDNLCFSLRLRFSQSKDNIYSTATLKNILQEKICIQMFKVLSKRLFKTGLLSQNEMKNHKYVTDLVFELKIELCYN